MSQDELAHAMGYKDRSMITKIESGKVDISQKKILAFAQVLHTSTSYLMGLEDERSIPIVVPSNELFNKVVKFMEPDDYVTVMTIFEKTYNKMKERGEI